MSSLPESSASSPFGFRSRGPEWVCALLALITRAIGVGAQWNGNAALRDPQLDALYYLDWAQQVAAGHLWSAGPIGADEPYLLNPLYAWCLAPLSAFGSGMHLATLIAQVLLGGATAWLAAAAARRHGGVLAAWIAGVGVATSAALVHLSTHVSVATLAAFLTAGVVFACAPPTESEKRGHGPLASGVWLGLGALARPVTLLALPFVAWLHKRRGGVRPAVIVLAVFAAFTAVTFARNWAVSGEAVPFTAANGLNLHLGQNPLARRTNSMLTDAFQFNPVTMHDDARVRVGMDLGRAPTRSEVSTWFRDATLREMAAHPTDALAHALNKARWFASPEEPASSADMSLDRRKVPWLRVGFLPTWLLVVLGLGGAWVARKDRALLLGAGGLVLAHIVSTTLAFPLSHYRAPAIPALCVLAAVGVSTFRQLARGPRVGAVVLVVALTGVGWLPPQPRSVPALVHLNTAIDAIRDRDLISAMRHAEQAAQALPDWTEPLQLKAQIHALRNETAESLGFMDQVVERHPWDLDARRVRAELLVDLQRPDDARAAAEALVADLPWNAAARGVRGSIRAHTGDLSGARTDLTWAMERGYWPTDRVLRLTGLARSPSR